jgi:hypothetical protein
MPRTAESAFEEAPNTVLTQFPVPLQGESGTGKEVLARFIHRDPPSVQGRFHQSAAFRQIHQRDGFSVLQANGERALEFNRREARVGGVDGKRTMPKRPLTLR